MNRLIIIGNGFDLAHGLKTSFNDFINYYYYSAIKTFLLKDSYLDSLLQIKFQNGFHTNKGSLNNLELSNTSEYVKLLRDNPNVLFKTKSILLQRITSSLSSNNWVDVEMEYFKLLKMTTNPNSLNVGKLNSEFTYLKKKLIEYLTIQQKENKIENNPDELLNCLMQNISPDELVNAKSGYHLTSLYFLNFNYTDTILPYFAKCVDRSMPSELNYIHGSLDSNHGEPIFGFGDEFDKKYLEFEDFNNNEYFSHIKSFEYSKNRNYFNLLRFIESQDFQVHIYGHSCGISDRTMLNSIFEHDNCISIKIFYHRYGENENDFTEKTYEIYRHFKDKSKMRRKIVPFNHSQAMPQPVIEFVNN